MARSIELGLTPVRSETAPVPAWIQNHWAAIGLKSRPKRTM